MEENTTPEKINVVQFTARVREEDKAFLNEFLAPYEKKHEGVSKLVSLLKQGENNPNPNPELEAENESLRSQLEISEFNRNEYKAAHDELKAELNAVTTKLQNAQTELGEIRQSTAQNANCFLIEFTPEVNNKLTLLRRMLKQQGKRPQDETETQFAQNFTNDALAKYIKNIYNFI